MDLDRDARRILDLAAGASSPEPEDKARIEKKLAAALGASALATTTTASATPTTSAASSGATIATGSALKWWIGASLIAASITGYVALSEPAPAPAKTAPTPVPVAPVVTAPPAPVPAPAISPEPEQEHVHEPQPIAAARRPAPRKPAEQTLDQELELLHRAQAAWRARQAASALSLLDEHKSRFPRSQLRLERDGLRVLTLCELGKKPEATALAKKLIERAPRSPLRKTIEESCALK